MFLDALISYAEEISNGIRIELCPRILPAEDILTQGREEMVIVTPVDFDLMYATVWGAGNRVKIIPRGNDGRWFVRNGKYLEEVRNRD